MRPLLLHRVLVLMLVILAGTAVQAANNPVPFLNFPLVPTATAPGGAGFTLTVNGTGFVSGAVVNWNGSPRTTTFVNSSQLTAAIAAADIAVAGTATITVTNPPPGGGISTPKFFQISNPTVGLAFQPTAIPSPNREATPVVGDFNGDGKLDMVVYTGFTNEVQIMIGNGDGTFQPYVNVVAAPDNTNVSDAVVGDFNGDGKLDIAVSYYANTLPSQPPQYGTSVILGNGDGTFQAPIVSDPSSTIADAMMVVADVNGDGIPDLVHGASQGIFVELGNGDGSFDLGYTYTTPPYVPVRAVALGDFHKSGKLDLVAAIEPGGLTLFPGNGDGSFGTPIVLDEPDTNFMSSVVAADFYNTGNLDIAYYYELPYPQTEGILRVLPGNGDGTFQPYEELGGLPVSPQPETLIPGDFNGDGHLDLAVQNVVILIFGPSSHSLVTAPAYIYTAGDFNGDGKLDFPALDSTHNVLQLLLQTEPPADFQGAINPSYQNIVTGSIASYGIAVTAANEFAGTVQFSTSGLPAGATATFTPSEVTGSGNTTLSISTTGATPAGSYSIIVSGTSGSLTHAGNVILNVGPPGSDFTDFGGAVTPQFQTVVPGSGTTYNISVFPLYGFSSNVSLSLSGLPAGATGTFNPSVVPGGSGASVLSVSTAASTPTATYPLLITSTAGSHVHTSGVSLNVGPSGTDFTDYTGSLTPLSQTISASSGGSTTFTATIQPINGTGCVYLQVYGLPANTNGHFDRSTGICGSPASTVFTITPSSLTPIGTYTLKFEGTTSGGNVHDGYVTLIVTP